MMQSTVVHSSEVGGRLSPNTSQASRQLLPNGEFPSESAGKLSQGFAELFALSASTDVASNVADSPLSQKNTTLPDLASGLMTETTESFILSDVTQTLETGVELDVAQLTQSALAEEDGVVRLGLQMAQQSRSLTPPHATETVMPIDGQLLQASQASQANLASSHMEFEASSHKISTVKTAVESVSFSRSAVENLAAITSDKEPNSVQTSKLNEVAQLSSQRVHVDPSQQNQVEANLDLENLDLESVVERSGQATSIETASRHPSMFKVGEPSNKPSDSVEVEFNEFSASEATLFENQNDRKAHNHLESVMDQFEVVDGRDQNSLNEAVAVRHAETPFSGETTNSVPNVLDDVYSNSEALVSSEGDLLTGTADFYAQTNRADARLVDSQGISFSAEDLGVRADNTVHSTEFNVEAAMKSEDHLEEAAIDASIGFVQPSSAQTTSAATAAAQSVTPSSQATQPVTQTAGNHTAANAVNSTGNATSSSETSAQSGQNSSQNNAQNSSQNNANNPSQDGQSKQSQQAQSLEQSQRQQAMEGRQQDLQLRERSFSEVLTRDQLKAEQAAEIDKLTNELTLTGERRSQLPLGLQAISHPLRHPQWGQALGQRVVYMSNNQVQEAKITLNPEKLGPVQVKLQLDKEQQVHVSMVAQHTTTKEAMEQALPKLKEMLESAGIQYASIDVMDERSQQSMQQDSSDSDSDSSSAPDYEAAEDEESVMESNRTQQVTDNLVDYYA